MFLAACLLLGLIVSIGDFLCTGQIYLATILYVMQSSNGLDVRAVLTFLGYGVAFVTPLLVLTFLVHRGREVFDVSEWVRRHMPAIKLVNACFFVLFGIWVVFFW
jgi:cytochrome c biogenesis protein CcdA